MSVSLMQLWLPIVIATILAWISSSLIHILLKYHNADYQRLDNEADVAAAIGAGSPQKGVHSIPYCIDMKEMADPALQKKFSDGPVAFVTVFDNGMPNMPKLIGQQIIFFLIGCTLIAYCATLSLTAGTPYMEVFRLVSAIGFLTFGWGQVPFGIWYGHRWATVGRFLLDALIYGLIVAGVFAWLWPGLV